MTHGAEIIVKAAAGHALVALHMPPIAPVSRRLYAGLYERLPRDEQGVPVLLSGSVNSWSLSRAAVARTSREMLLACIKRMQAGEPAAAMLDELSVLVRVADAYPWNPEQGKPRQGSARGTGSKRQAASALPAGWLDELWSRAASRRDGKPARCLDALAVACISGCRPSELETGVRVERHGEGLLLTVTTAKAAAGSSRAIRVTLDSPMAAHLHRLAGDGDLVVRHDAKGFSNAVADVAGETWGRRISAYDIRHSRAADVRAQDGTATASDLLGHTSRDTLRYYGRRPKAAGKAMLSPGVEQVVRTGARARNPARIRSAFGAGAPAPGVQNPIP